MRRVLLVLALMAPTLAAVAADTAGPITVRSIEPRGFGYFVGDVFRREIDFVVAAPYHLDRSSVPKPGRLNYWLDLRAVDLAEVGGSGGQHYRLSLDYQTFYVPLSSLALTVPSFMLRATGTGDASAEAEVPPFTFAMAALREVLPEKPAAGPVAYLKPDVAPRLIGTLNARIGLGAGAALSLLALILLAYHYAWWPFRARPARPFTAAARAIRRERARSESLAAYRAGLLDLHRAFDSTAGQRLLAEDVPGFLASHSQFLPLEADIARFFANSRRAFFGNDVEGAAKAMPMDALSSLGVRLGEAERRTA